MKFLPTFLLVIVFASVLQSHAQVPVPTAPEKPATAATARSKASEFAEGITRDGYTMRDGCVVSEVDATKPLFIEVNLFEGNNYWFCAATATLGSKLSIALFNEKDQPLKMLDYSAATTVAGGFVPKANGRYFVRVALEEGTKTQVCFLYLYK